MADREIDRIGRKLEQPLPSANWEFTMDLGDDPDQTIDRIESVVRLFVSHGSGEWPNDDAWRGLLPKWLTSFIPPLTIEECDRLLAETPRERWDDLPWEFGSWLDAIRERDWKWWGLTPSGKHARLVLEVTGIPPHIDAFKQILLASGAQILSENGFLLY